MGRKSTKENKTPYQISRENLGYTREQASELLEFISSDRLEKIENERSVPHPDEALAMAKAYKDYSLCNYYCSHECQIGQEYTPEIKIKNIAEITLEMLDTLNALSNAKDRLLEIMVDGKISEDEAQDFIQIHNNLERMALVISSLDLWARNEYGEKGDKLCSPPL